MTRHICMKAICNSCAYCLTNLYVLLTMKFVYRRHTSCLQCCRQRYACRDIGDRVLHNTGPPYFVRDLFEGMWCLVVIACREQISQRRKAFSLCTSGPPATSQWQERKGSECTISQGSDSGHQDFHEIYQSGA